MNPHKEKKTCICQYCHGEGVITRTILSAETIREMRKLRAEGWSLRAIGKRFNVTHPESVKYALNKLV
jgi:hypothetical protein